jgi:hypothetical protein
MFKDFANMDAPTLHDVSYKVVEVFEEYLESIDVAVPCADEEEEAERLKDDNPAALYGKNEYWRLRDDVENWFCSFPHLADVYSSKFLATFDELLDARNLSEYKPHGEQRAALKAKIDKELKNEEEE